MPHTPPPTPSGHTTPRPVPGLAPHPGTFFVPPRGTTFQLSWRSPLDRGHSMPLLAALLRARRADGWIPTSPFFPAPVGGAGAPSISLDSERAGAMLQAAASHQAQAVAPLSGRDAPTVLSCGPVSFLLAWQGLRSITASGAMVWTGFPAVFSPDKALMRVLPWEISWSGTQPMALVLGMGFDRSSNVAQRLADAVAAYPVVARTAAERAAGMPALPWSLFEGMDASHQDWPEGDRWPLATARAIARYLGLPPDSAYQITISGARWKTWDTGPDGWMEQGGILPPEATLHLSCPPGVPSAVLQATAHHMFKAQVAARAQRDPLAWMRRDAQHVVDTLLSCRPSHGAMTAHLRLLEERVLADLRATA